MTNDEGSPSLDTRASSFFRHSSFELRHSPLSLPLSPLSLLLDPPASGAWNMAVDETLLEAAASEGQCTLRFYQWDEPTLSLGYFQASGDRLRHPASAACPMVRRPSGGGAILHDLELTYSLAAPERHPLAAGRLRTYRMVHDALIEALAQWGIAASLFDLWCGRPGCTGAGETPAPQAPAPQTQHQPFLCFQRRSPGDVLVGDAKIAGSAQRRCRGAVLQHGSLLLARSAAAPELDGLKELSGRAIVVEEIIQAWLERLAGGLGITWRRGELSQPHRRQAARLAAEKYASNAWTNIR
jgi:lipoate-protein ligase A